jgi:chromosome segregation ATPase
MPTMTAAAITTAIDARRERIRELTETEQTLEKTIAAGRNAISREIARGHNVEISEEVAAARESVRTDSDRLAETKSAIAMLNGELVDLEAQLKKAEAREWTERATQSAADARSAIDVVRSAVYEAASKIGDLAHSARMAMDQANSDDANSKSANGLPVTGMGVVHLPPGLEEVLHNLHSFTHRQDVSPTGPPVRTAKDTRKLGSSSLAERVA